MKVFVDTSFLVALAAKRDRWHERAIRAVRPEMVLFTSSTVINEAVSLLQARGHFTDSLIFLREARRTERLTVLYPEPALQSQAWESFARWGKLGANAVDCISFALMKNYSIRTALTFDQRFRMAGFEVMG